MRLLVVLFLAIAGLAQHQQQVYLEDVPGYQDAVYSMKRVTGIIEVHRPAAHEKLRKADKEGDQNKIFIAFGELQQVEDELLLHRKRLIFGLLEVEKAALAWYQDGKLTERSYDRALEFAAEAVKTVARSANLPRGYEKLVRRTKPAYERVRSQQAVRQHSPI